jgi:hypothetical protein
MFLCVCSVTHQVSTEDKVVFEEPTISTLDAFSIERARATNSKRRPNPVLELYVAVPGEPDALGTIGLTGNTYPAHDITNFTKCNFKFCNSASIPRKKEDCGMVVPTFHFITVGWYQTRVFNDVDNNLTVLKKHYALGVYGKLNFQFKPHYVSMEEYETIVGEIVSKKGTMDFADLAECA